jgi:hypothetical protein
MIIKQENNSATFQLAREALSADYTAPVTSTLDSAALHGAKEKGSKRVEVLANCPTEVPELEN